MRWNHGVGAARALCLATVLGVAFAAPQSSAAAETRRAAPPQLAESPVGSVAPAPLAATLFQPVVARPHSAAAFGAVLASPAAQPASTAFGQALERILAGDDQSLRSAYAATGYAPIWLDVDGAGRLGGSAKARALIEAFALADAHALPAARYGGDALAQRLGGGDLTALAALERDLSRAFVAIAADLHGGVLEPKALSGDMDLKPPRLRVEALLAMARSERDPARLLEDLAPQTADYQRLKQLWAALRDLVRGGVDSRAITGRTLRRGDADPTVGDIRARLASSGDLPAAEVASPVNPATGAPLFDAALDRAVRAFQRRHGLAPDGVVGAMTYAALNVGVVARATQAAVNLEQSRWRNRPLGRRHLLVNIPDFHVDLVRDGRIMFRSRVIVGKREHQTPEFSDELEYMVVNPKWNVPNSIATEEFLPQLQRDPYALATRNINILDRGNGAPVEPGVVNWSTISRANFPFRLVQSEGAGNALGSVKFMFPNRHAVYLHDTPAKHLFARPVRAYSHGCIRVADPERMAYALLEPQDSQPQTRYATLRARPGEQYEHLTQPMPVHIVYRTAWVEGDGAVHFREDIYGRDAIVALALARLGLRL